jgi:D-alanyl-D-alanine carboxypeptidase (penicillin-binding protein 5/6)
MSKAKVLSRILGYCVLEIPRGFYEDFLNLCLRYGFAHYKRTQIQPSLEENLYLPVKKGTEKQVKVTAEENFSALLRKNEAEKVTSEVILPENLTAPVTKGQQIGEIRYLLEGEEIGIVPICAENDIKKLDIWCSFAILLKYLCAH